MVHYPEGNVLLRNLNKTYPVVSHGKGCFLYDTDGKDYFDASGGALVTSLGHGNAELVDAAATQLKQVAYVNGTQFTSKAMEDCAQKLAALAKPIGLDRVALLGSGSEAVEAAIKFCRQLWVDRGEKTKHKLIARTPGYHGNTLYALSASGRPHYKTLYGPLISEVFTVSTPYPYRSSMTADDYAAELEALILKENAETISAFILEPVSGSSTGAALASTEYFKKIQAICKKHKILIIADEVMCGAGRSGKFFACEHYDFKPDVLVMGKGINAGMFPVSAIMVRDEDLNTMKNASGAFQHAQTYMNAPSMAATVLAVLNFMEKNKVLDHAASVSAHWLAKLQSEIAPLPHIGNISGIGHMAGVEFVEDKNSKKPFPVSQKVALKFAQHAQDHGLILWPNYGQADGLNGDLVMMGPPLTMTMADADECVERLKLALESWKF